MMTKLTFVLMMMFSLSVFAWVPSIQVQVTPHTALVQVANHTPNVIFCQGNAYGLTQTGVWLNSWYSNYIAPYSYANVYVYAYAPYYFVNATANINCY